MVSEWNATLLGNVMTLKRGYDLPSKSRIPGEVPIFSSSGISGTNNKPMCSPPGVITGRYGTIGQVFFSAEPYWPLNTTLYVEDFKSNDPKFIYYFLKTVHWEQFSGKSAVPGINRNDIHRLEVVWPSIMEQKSIAAILTAFDDKIELNQKINDNLQQQALTLYEKQFPYSVTDELPTNWRVGTVGNIVEIHDSKRIPLSGAQRDKMKKRIYPYYGAASLMDYVDDYIFDGKYLLLGEDGTVVDDASYPILQYVWGKFWVNNHAHILTGQLGHSVESLLLLFKRTPVKSIVTGAVQPKISQANLRSIPVVIPPQSELDAFNELIRPLFDQIRQNQDQNKALATLRDALLPKLMSGEIDIASVEV